MRTDLLRWGGIGALLLAALYVAVLAVGFTMGVDIYADGDDDLRELMTDIDDNKVAFAAWAILGISAPLLVFPAVLGLSQTAKEEDLPFFALAAAFFGLAVVLEIIAYTSALILGDIVNNWDGATGPEQEALLRDAESIQNFFLILGGIAFTPFGLGMFGVGVLSLRSRFFPRWLAWPLIAVGLIGTAPFVGWIAMVPGRILFAAITGAIMLRRSGEPSPTPEVTTRPATASA
jgi:Domain of unknown function (DUF4386)